jgi:acetyl-CoA acyltransferase 1
MPILFVKCLLGMSLDILKQLKPVFKENGVTTEGNSSQTTDRAAAVLLMTRAEATRRGLPILGVWRGYAVKGVAPCIMGIGPAVVIPAVLDQCQLTIQDIDVFEINEAFASQATWCVEVLGIDPQKVNPNGGAIALGHPLGCTGARQIATLWHKLHRRKQRYGVVSMCIGTRMGAAAVLEVETESRLHYLILQVLDTNRIDIKCLAVHCLVLKQDMPSLSLLCSPRVHSGTLLCWHIL